MKYLDKERLGKNRYLQQGVSRRKALKFLGGLAMAGVTSHPGFGLFTGEQKKLLAGEPPGVSRASNVLMISIDTLRPDCLGCYGYERETSPNIDTLLSSSRLFAHAFAQCTTTTPSHVSLLTGTYPTTHRCDDNTYPLRNRKVSTMAELLRDAGYDTAGFVSAYPMKGNRDRKERGVEAGFSHYDNSFSRMLSAKLRRSKRERPGDETTNAAVKWLDKRDGSQPFFLFVHYFDPHAPYVPPREFSQRFQPASYESCGNRSRWPLRGEVPEYAMLGDSLDLRRYAARYDAEISFVDHHVGRLLRHIREAGVRENTMVVLTSDHGESLGEHRRFCRHGGLYDVELRVPLLISLPESLVGKEPPMRQVDHFVELVDVLPTVLEVAGVQIPEIVQGTSLVPILTGKGNQAAKTTAFGISNRGEICVRTEHWKYIRKADEEVLFDLDGDPAEDRNVAAREKRAAADLRQLADSWHSLTLFKLEEEKPYELSSEEKEALRSLGYMH